MAPLNQRHLVLLAAFGAACSGSAYCADPAALAASAAATPEALETLPPVNITGLAPSSDYRPTESATFTKTETPLKEIPASVTIVPAQLMRDQAMQSLADVIRYVPGALAHQGEGNRDEFILRGIDSSANLYVDGIRDDAQVFRDLYNLDRVEVLKGAAGMIFGRGAGGVVNRVTKKPRFEHVGEASLTLGMHDQVRATADVGGANGELLAWRLNAMGEKSHSFRDGVELERYAFNPTLTWRAGPVTALTVGYEHLHDERTADRGFPSFNGRPLEADPSTFFGNAEQSTAHSYVDGAYAILDHSFGAVQLRNTLRVTRYDKYYQNVFPATTVPVSAAGLVTLNAYNNANQRTNTFNQTDLTGTRTIGDMEHTWLAGIELGHQDSSNKRNTGFFGAAPGTPSVTVPVSDPIAVATAFRANGTDADNNVKADIAAIYVQDQIALTQQWKLLAGLRYDYFKTTFDDRRTTLTPATTPSAATDLARTDKEFSPRLGLIWSPTSTATYYISYSYSFLPSAETLGLTVLDPKTGLSSADFAPENAKNYEIGAHWDLSPVLTLSAAIFRLDRNNVRNADGNGGFVQTGQQRTQGVELGLQGEVLPHWQVFGGYAYLDSRITEATAAAGTLGHHPQLVPRNTASLWNRFDIGSGFGAGLGLIYQDSSYPNADNAVVLPSFTRTDVALYYVFPDRKTRLALNVENLFDKKYFPTADANNNITVGSTRNARLTLNTTF
jgi:catecholate siderophore receptor